MAGVAAFGAQAQAKTTQKTKRAIDGGPLVESEAPRYAAANRRRESGYAAPDINSVAYAYDDHISKHLELQPVRRNINKRLPSEDMTRYAFMIDPRKANLTYESKMDYFKAASFKTDLGTAFKESHKTYLGVPREWLRVNAVAPVIRGGAKATDGGYVTPSGAPFTDKRYTVHQ